MQPLRDETCIRGISNEDQMIQFSHLVFKRTHLHCDLTLFLERFKGFPETDYPSEKLTMPTHCCASVAGGCYTQTPPEKCVKSHFDTELTASS